MSQFSELITANALLSANNEALRARITELELEALAQYCKGYDDGKATHVDSSLL